MNSRTKLLILPLFALVLISCNLLSPGGPLSTTTAATPDLVQTLTAMAPTGIASVETATSPAEASPFPTATEEPAQPTDTSEPTETSQPPTTKTKVPVVQVTPVVSTPAKTAPVTRCNWAQFVKDVTVPDGTTLGPGDTFQKVWRLKNIGTCAWDENYTLAFTSGRQMTNNSGVSLPTVVEPGETVDVRVDLTAPSTTGTYTGYWRLANANGTQFGIGDDAKGSFYVQIKVIEITPIPSATRINFRSNATEANLSGSLGGGKMKPYVIRAAAGQVMMVRVVSPGGDVNLQIYGVSGAQTLVDADAGETSWQGKLPATQDYIIQLWSTGGNTTFTLQVIIPERISFASGAISASRSGPLRARETHTFILRALAGQTMTLTLTPDNQDALLGFYGYQDGQPYLRREAGQTSWQGTVPATQDYIIQVFSVVDNDMTYTLDVQIE